MSYRPRKRARLMKRRVEEVSPWVFKCEEVEAAMDAAGPKAQAFWVRTPDVDSEEDLHNLTADQVELATDVIIFPNKAPIKCASRMSELLTNVVEDEDGNGAFDGLVYIATEVEEIETMARTALIEFAKGVGLVRVPDNSDDSSDDDIDFEELAYAALVRAFGITSAMIDDQAWLDAIEDASGFRKSFEDMWESVLELPDALLRVDDGFSRYGIHAFILSCMRRLPEIGFLDPADLSDDEGMDSDDDEISSDSSPIIILEEDSSSDDDSSSPIAILGELDSADESDDESEGSGIIIRAVSSSSSDDDDLDSSDAVLLLEDVDASDDDSDDDDDDDERIVILADSSDSDDDSSDSDSGVIVVAEVSNSDSDDSDNSDDDVPTYVMSEDEFLRLYLQTLSNGVSEETAEAMITALYLEHEDIVTEKLEEFLSARTEE